MHPFMLQVGLQTTAKVILCNVQMQVSAPSGSSLTSAESHCPPCMSFVELKRMQVECMRQRLPPAGAATRSLTDLGQPTLDWCALAQGMGVPAAKAATVEDMTAAMERGLSIDGPFLIEACLL